MSDQKKERAGQTGTDARFHNALLVVVAALCTFGGPYLVYALTRSANLDMIVSAATGFVLFAVGLVLIAYLIRKKVIS